MVSKSQQKRVTALKAAKRPTLTARVLRLEKAAFPAKPKTIQVAAPVARFVKLGADCKATTGDYVAVHDTRTGLIWSAEPLQSGKEFKHADAMAACKALDLCGHKDWRAPTIDELLSIVDRSRVNPAADSVFKGPYGWTWSSTPYAGDPSGAAWGVGLYYGGSGWSYHGFHCRARAVRAGQAFGSRGVA